jgi:hypothetical protein
MKNADTTSKIQFVGSHPRNKKGRDPVIKAPSFRVSCFADESVGIFTATVEHRHEHHAAGLRHHERHVAGLRHHERHAAGPQQPADFLLAATR